MKGLYGANAHWQTDPKAAAGTLDRTEAHACNAADAIRCHGQPRKKKTRYCGRRNERAKTEIEKEVDIVRR